MYIENDIIMEREKDRYNLSKKKTKQWTDRKTGLSFQREGQRNRLKDRKRNGQ